jgi:thiamine-phosphate pyrophosphorylase
VTARVGPRLPPIYAILDAERSARRSIDPIALFETWLAAGIRLVQLRAKTLPAGEFLKLATELSAKAERAGATFIVNDRADIAAASRASGVHLGQEDLSPEEIRPVVGPTAIVGLSTHNRVQVEAALRQPVTYVAIGPVFATRSKANPDPVVGLEGIAEAVALAGSLPVVAIGGITVDRVADVLRAGATSVAVISDLLEGDPSSRARQFLGAAKVDESGT